MNFLFTQDEKYAHIEEEEMKKVEKAVIEKDAWLNQKFQAQSQLPLHQDPIVHAVSILAEKKVHRIVLYS